MLLYITGYVFKRYERTMKRKIKTFLIRLILVWAAAIFVAAIFESYVVRLVLAIFLGIAVVYILCYIVVKREVFK